MRLYALSKFLLITIHVHNWIHFLPLALSLALAHTHTLSICLFSYLFCFVLLSFLVLSCLVLCFLVLLCLALSCSVLSCLVVSYLALPCLVLSCLVLCQKTDDFYLGRGHYPLLSYCLPGSLMNQANTRKLERDHTMKVKRRVRDKKVFFLLLSITSVYYW